ncbi:MAG: superoxide dismutase [Bacteroidales bacterium]|nr:superoxide dismutase [Bacteroidales bacterium]MCF8327313.1 superoxide dismutase [Bacteroidales bacterium]
MKHQLPELPYAKDALEPHISADTLHYHHDKHHQKYVDNLNNLIPGTEFEDASLEEIIKKAEGGIFNNGAQVWNHTFYWNCMTPNGGGKPEGKLAEAIERDFGSFDAFKEAFTKAAATLFGSGWAWLSKDDQGKLHISQGKNAENPIRDGLTPLLTCDVWEHAFYLDKQNKKPDYIEDFFKLIDWKKVSERY